ncbi:MAG: rhamnose ABC transporter substrate-binding protein [Thermoleophilia bacterium]|nr:rhamnose ABC transporter substrate-binding protein [Thermoleophilia bacterium]
MERTKRLFGAFALLLVALVFALAACGGDDDDDEEGAGGEGEGYSLYMIPKNVGNPVFDLANKGMQAAAKELGDTTQFNGPAEADPQQQVQVINSAVAQGPDALIISANDPDAILPALQNAREKDVEVVTFDSDANPEGRTVFASTPEAQKVGETQIEMCGSQINYKGDIAILSATPTATNQNTWIKFMKETLEQDKYKNMKLVTTVYGNDDPTKSTEEAQGLLQAYRNLKCIIAPTTVGIAATARVVSQQNACKRVVVTGLGLPSEMRDFVKSGCVKKNALWSFEDLGYLAAYAAHAVVSGEVSGEEGESFEAGKLGAVTVDANGAVYLPELLVFTPQNIDKYKF